MLNRNPVNASIETVGHNVQMAGTYQNWVGFVFIFNIIVGTGALTLPAVFAKAGWLLGLITIILLAITSYITVTFLIETMAAANAVKTWQNLQLEFNGKNDSARPTTTRTKAMPTNLYVDHIDDNPTAFLLPRTLNENADDDIVDNSSSTTPCIPVARGSVLMYYHLDQRIELGEMAALYLSNFGRIAFYLCFCIYLYGDLSIYSAAVAKTLRDIFCDHLNSSSGLQNDVTLTPSIIKNNKMNLNMIIESPSLATSKHESYEEITMLCWHNHTLTRLNVYRLLLVGFVALFGPLVAFSVQKTKHLQVFTAAYRWCAFIFMISIAIKMLAMKGARGHPMAFNPIGLPGLFGACVYSFMCHHSVPSLLVPLRNKNDVLYVLGADYVIICLFYILLSITGIFAFDKLDDLYTLNFIPDQTDYYSLRGEVIIVVDYILALFPVLTLSASYPIVAITLRNNLQILFIDRLNFDQCNLFVRRILFPLIVIFPPLFITFFTESVINLVAFTGTYAGTCIQFLIPIVLVYCARSTCRDLLGTGIINNFQSPFRSNFWLIFIFLWSMSYLMFVTINSFTKHKM